MPIPNVLIVAIQASASFGGESVLPLHYYKGLKEKKTPVKMVVHERTKDELNIIFHGDCKDITFIKDTWFHKFLYKFSTYLPSRIYSITFGLLLDLVTEATLKAAAKEIIKSNPINIVHVPIRVSPKFPSLIYNMGVPVIFGPMNGGMTYPKAFSYMEGGIQKYFIKLGRAASNTVNRLIPGKYYADTLLVSNERTKQALPKTKCNDIRVVIENGVDLRLFKAIEVKTNKEETNNFTLIYIGRLVDWKCVDILLKAIAKCNVPDILLHIVGEGNKRIELENLTKRLNIEGKIKFHGFVSQDKCPQFIADANCLILPSVYECGGAVVLEAMAMGKPVISTNWGGPKDYINDDSGILVDVGNNENDFIDNLVMAINSIAINPLKAKSMGIKGLERIKSEFDWSKKIDNMLNIYKSKLKIIS
jgi:glycosyltransferase involved in cell wall biosynthesis